MFDYGHFRFENKQALFDKSIRFWNPGKTQFWQETGVDLVIDRREGYFLYDMDGRRLIDLHLNGGTYNLGHRNPELVETLNGGARLFRHRQPPVPLGRAHRAGRGADNVLARHDLCRSSRPAAPRRSTSPSRPRATPPSGARSSRSSRAITAIPGWRWRPATTGSPRSSSSDQPDEFIQVPFNDLAAMEARLKGGDVAAVIMETIPATYGFPMPSRGYLQGVQDAVRAATARSTSPTRCRPA